MKMNSAFLIVLIIACCIGCVVSVCYREVGCVNTRKKYRDYKIGQRWKSSSDPCYSCKCIKRKKFAMACLEPVNKRTELSVRKSLFTGRFESSVNYNLSEDRRISELETMECPPTPIPVYNWTTGTFEPTKIVYYYYIRKVSRCCSRFTKFSYVHPSCKVVKISRCQSKAVMKNNPRKICGKRMS
ncbi:uncharacterized protein LOC120347344 [Styela clava]